MKLIWNSIHLHTFPFRRPYTNWYGYSGTIRVFLIEKTISNTYTIKHNLPGVPLRIGIQFNNAKDAKEVADKAFTMWVKHMGFTNED